MTLGSTLPLFQVLIFALGITGIVFIAIVLFLDIPLRQEPIKLPEKVDSQ